MCRETVVRVLLLGLVAASLIFVPTMACGAAQEEPKSRPLPVFDQELRPGYYRSQEFEPHVSFRVGKGWKTQALCGAGSTGPTALIQQRCSAKRYDEILAGSNG